MTPQIFYEDFVKMGEDGLYPTGGWTTWGIDATPGDNNAEIDQYMKAYFEDKDESYLLLQYGATTIAISNTNFIPATTADQWLISPEIEIPEENMSLYFTTGFYNNKGSFGSGKAPIAVYVSETGNAKEDFGETPIYTYNLSPSTANTIALKNFIIPMNGYKGKKVHLAFVQRGKSCGPVGFTNIGLGQYFCEFDDSNTPSVGLKGEKITISNNIGMKTPVACASVNAVLEINGEKVAEKDIAKNLGTTSVSQQYVNVSFDNVYEMKDESLNYKLLITPQFEGAITSTFEGTIGYPVTNYPNNCVVEEVTATGCQACPAGTASMNYYAENYPAGHPTRGRFIGIAIHGLINYFDPMSEGVSAYLSQALDKTASTTYPGANFNRSTIGMYPWSSSSMNREILSRSYNKAEVVSVTVPDVESTEDMYGRKVVVKYNVYSAYDAESRNLSASVVMIENDVKGYESGYTQTNGFYNRTSDYITSNYGQFLVPYMTDYLAGGSLGYSMIPFDKMVYNHVARGIFPSYAGEPIKGAWTADEPRELEISFELPDNVMEWKNTEVIILITDDSKDGKIVASDILDAKDFKIGDSAVNSVADDNTLICKEGRNIVVTADADVPVEVYGIDGTLLCSYETAGAPLSIDGSAFNGLVIVKVANVTKKMMF